MRAFEFAPGLYRSPLPKAMEIASLRDDVGLASVLDLTQRPRPTVERACARNGIVYAKMPMPYDGGDVIAAATALLNLPRPALVHCFHGRNRTGRVTRAAAMMESGSVHLYRVGRNLNRAVRTMEAFGMRKLHLVECNEAKLSGRLYGASGKVQIVTDDALPSGDDVLVLETGDYPTIQSAPLHKYRRVIIGGETFGTPRLSGVDYATIPMAGNVSGLTVEAALAIALWEWMR